MVEEHANYGPIRYCWPCECVDLNAGTSGLMITVASISLHRSVLRCLPWPLSQLELCSFGCKILLWKSGLQNCCMNCHCRFRA